MTVRQWFFLDSVEVLAPSDVGAIVAFGDSIVDGAGTTYDANRRWPDFLARRLVAENKNFGVLNQGINGNKVLHSLLGDSALLRFDKDVSPGRCGYVIMLEGSTTSGWVIPMLRPIIIAGYHHRAAHAAGLKIRRHVDARGGHFHSGLQTYDESKRQAVNLFIREGGAFDAVVDFDHALSDPADPSHWRAGLTHDSIHPSDDGAETMADAIDLSLFQ
jgi:hypothetical protein